jgi:hypothetical protein
VHSSAFSLSSSSLSQAISRMRARSMASLDGIRMAELLALKKDAEANVPGGSSRIDIVSASGLIYRQ